MNPNSGDTIFRLFQLQKWKGEAPDSLSVPQTAGEAAYKGFQFYQMLQCDDGHWAGDYGGPMFLMPGLISVIFLTKIPFPKVYKNQGVISRVGHSPILFIGSKAVNIAFRAVSLPIRAIEYSIFLLSDFGSHFERIRCSKTD